MEQVVSCFAMKMPEGHNVRETQSEVYRSQSTPVFAEERILFQVEIRVCHREVERVLLQRGRTGKGSREELRDDCVRRSQERD